MATIQQGESTDIDGAQSVQVVNLDDDKSGSYDITGDGIAINKQIPGGDTQTENVYGNPVEVTNTGKPALEVTGV